MLVLGKYSEFMINQLSISKANVHKPMSSYLDMPLFKLKKDTYIGKGKYSVLEGTLKKYMNESVRPGRYYPLTKDQPKMLSCFIGECEAG